MNSNDALLIDVDGTILDVREKYWAAHSYLAQRLGEAPGSQERFWMLKRQQASLFQLLNGWERSSISTYGRRWATTVEMPQFTALDEPFEGSKEALARLRGRFSIVAISMRRNPGLLLDSLGAASIDRLLDGTVILGAHTSRELSKAGLLRSSPYADLSYSWVIGDSDDDIGLAQSIGVRALAVLSGLRDLPYLLALGPDGVVDSIADVPRFLGATPSSAPLICEQIPLSS